MPPVPIRILMVDDHPVVREGLKALIGGHPGIEIEVAGEAADASSAKVLADTVDPDVVVDVSMPGRCGAEVTVRLRRAKADRKVLALTVHEDVRDLLRALRDAGATGNVPKGAAADELLVAIRIVTGGVDASPAPPADVPPAAKPAGLSVREVEVVRLVAGGYSNKEIAAKLTVSVKTVETYKARAMEKLGVRTRVGLVQYALGRGWLAAAPTA